jgi:hypothetical protein
MKSATAELGRLISGPVRRDPKRSAVLAGLLVVLAVLGTRHHLKSMPRAAEAAIGTPDALVPGAAIGLTGSTSGDHLLAWLGDEIRPVARDAFRVDRPALTASESQVRDSAPVAEPDEAAKLDRREADEQRVRRFDESAIVSAARRLRVQSTIEGANPSALVNGRLLRPGDAILADQGIELTVRSVDRGRVTFEARGVGVSVGTDGEVQLVSTPR